MMTILSSPKNSECLIEEKPRRVDVVYADTDGVNEVDNCAITDNYRGQRLIHMIASEHVIIIINFAM
jgi:hypothetical protein